MRTDLTIVLKDAELAAWLYMPEGVANPPLIVMSHGLAAVKEMSLDKTAETFCAAGLACLVYDHRNTGGSSGELRNHLDPWSQINDMRDVITYGESLPGIDSKRIGIWGTSWSGGHVMVVGATDRRVKCVVTQVPTISGMRNTLRAIPADKFSNFLEELYEERRRLCQGEAPTYVRISAEGSDGAQWSSVAGAKTPYHNTMTLLTRELRMAYEPGVYLPLIGPTPLLMIVATRDVRVPTDEQLAGYATAREPKKFVLLDGGHYDPYTTLLPQAAGAARDWFVEHLVK
jgi:fermentation-respiration switch protein FrsA (DUF1100 family)